jgi:hypothetical protein
MSISPQIDFSSFDKFNRKKLADSLTEGLTKFSPFYDEGFVLGLNATFGAGKTTFLQMWGKELKDKGHKVVSINAWETDFDNNPIIPILSAFIEAFPNDNEIKNSFKGGLLAAGLCGNDIIAHTTGINIAEALKKVEQAADPIKEAEDIYQEYTLKKKSYETIRQKLREYIKQSDQKPIIVLVDELDRVRPDYAIQFLEAIKHLFGVKGVCFVLAVNRKQIQKSIQQIYGDIDFESYYLRFVTREADLPELKNIDINPYLNDLADKFWTQKQAEGVNFCFKKDDEQEILFFMEQLFRECGLLPRQIESVFRTFSQIMAIETGKKSSKLLRDAALFLLAIRVENPDIYRQIGQRVIDMEVVLKYLKSKNFRDDVHPRLMYVFAQFLYRPQESSYSLRVLEDGFKEENRAKDILDSITREFRFTRIINRIESWGNFID